MGVEMVAVAACPGFVRPPAASAAAATTTLFPPSSSVFCWPEWPARKKVGGKEEEEASLPLPHPWENLAIFSQRRRKGGKDRCVEKEEEVGKHTGQQRRTRRRYSIGEVERTDWRKRRHKKALERMGGKAPTRKREDKGMVVGFFALHSS